MLLSNPSFGFCQTKARGKRVTQVKHRRGMEGSREMQKKLKAERTKRTMSRWMEKKRKAASGRKGGKEEGEEHIKVGRLGGW